MDPISPVIDAVEEVLGHSPHPAIVTVPIGSWVVSNICDGLAMATGEDSYDDAARLSMAVGLAGASVAIVTGLRDYSYISPERESHGVATAHGLGNAVVASLFTASYILRTRSHARGEPTGPLARVLALAGGGLSLYTAWLGGKLVEEYGEGVQPVMEQQMIEEEFPDDLYPVDSEAELVSPEGGDDQPHGRDRLAPESPLGTQNP